MCENSPLFHRFGDTHLPSNIQSAGLILEILLGCVPDRSRSPAERTADIVRQILEGALRKREAGS